MSGFLNNMHERHQQHREQREERREARHERHDRGGRYDDREDREDHNDYGSRRYGQGYRHEDEDEGPRRPQSYESRFQGQGLGREYGPPAGPPPSARGPSGPGSLGGLDRGDFASDADIDRMIATGEFNKRQGREERGYEHGYGGSVGGERGDAYGRYDVPSGPPPGQGYGGRANEYGRYDAPSGAPPGRGYQSQQSHQQEYGSGGAYASSYGEEPERQNQYGLQQTQGRSQYETPQGPPLGRGRGQGNAPSGGFASSRGGEERYGTEYGGPHNDRSEPPRRGEAASYYDQQGASGQGDRYAHLAGIAQEHGNDDPELYRRATQGLQEKIQSQAQSRRPKRDDDEEGYRAHVDAHRKAYGGDDHGPMDADTIGAAAAMEAFKQTAAAAAGSSNAPAGAFQVGKASGGSSSKLGRAAREEEVEEEEETTAARAGASGGLQDKLMALAMSQAGKLFDKKNAGSSASGGDGSQGKAQAMQSAAATAMELFTQYQSKGKLESGDMSKVMGLAMNLL